MSSLGCPLQGQLAVILCGNSLCGNGPCCGCVVLTKTGKFSVVLGENLFPCTIQPFKLCWHFKQPRNTPTPITLETRLCAGFPPEHGVLEAQWQRVSLHPSLVWLGSQQAVCAALNLCSAVSASSARIPGRHHHATTSQVPGTAGWTPHPFLLKSVLVCLHNFEESVLSFRISVGSGN